MFSLLLSLLLFGALEVKARIKIGCQVAVGNTIKSISPTTITKTTAATMITANTVMVFEEMTVGVTGAVTTTVALVVSARN